MLRQLLLLIAMGAPVANAVSAPVAPSLDQSTAIDSARVQEFDDEKVEPYMGSLRLKNVDLHIRGNGGFDISVVRAYSSSRVAVGSEVVVSSGLTPIPLGWTIHFGRLYVRYPTCTGSSTNINYMPILETPDGVRRLVWRAQQSGSPPMMTTDNWFIACSGSGYQVISPDGLRYDMQHAHVGGSVPCPIQPDPGRHCRIGIYSATRITDRNGNFATIDYRSYNFSRPQLQVIFNEPMPVQLSTNDGRVLTFTHTILGTTEDLKRPFISAIQASTGERVTYGYTNLGSDNWALTSVTDPAGRRWSYQYHVPRQLTDWRCNVQITCDALPSDFLLKTVITPWGGTRGYTWLWIPQRYMERRPPGLAGKTTSDGGVWTYTYQYDRANAKMITSVAGPHGAEQYRHQCFSVDTNVVGDAPPHWANGLLLEETRGVAQTIRYQWKGQRLNSDWATLVDYVNEFDARISTRPVMVSRLITLDLAAYSTTYSGHDQFGSPASVSEVGVNGASRLTSRTYLNDTARWIIGQLKDESFPGSATQRTFDSAGNLLSYIRDGVSTSYTYDAQGNLVSKTLPRGLVHSYTNYKRGTPQSETQPEGVNLTRVVNDSGYVTSATNGEGRTTTYSYDAIGRETAVVYPAGNPKTSVYTATSKTNTRGSLVEVKQYDGFGRVVSVNVGGIVTTYAYDPLGRKTFESNPGSISGTSTQYDVLGRVVRLTNADGTYQSYGYGPGAATHVTNERGFTTSYTYRAYGDPAERHVVGISPADTSASITLTRNARDFITSMTQAGVTRTFQYDSRYFLSSAWSPETGTTLFGRDAAGNMTSRSVGGSAATVFAYDGQNRVSSITYPYGAPAVTYTYTRNNKLRSAATSVAYRSFGYDASDNRISDSLVVDGQTFNTAFGFNGNDALATITYPGSGNVVSYYPDVLGRPTQVSGYVSSVAYWPSGQLRQVNYANGTVSTYNQNNRLWPSSFVTFKNGGSTYSSSVYGYDPVGNLTSINDSVDGAFNRALGFDALDRLVSASGPWGAGTISYSAAGNITSQVFGGSVLSYNYDTANRLLSVSGARNASFGYDVYGNTRTVGSMALSYDGALNLRCAHCSSSARVDYHYDGLGRRAMTIRSGVKTYEVYGEDGNLLYELTPSPFRQVEYIYLGGKRVAQRATPN